jgi:hypothetical protein
LNGARIEAVFMSWTFARLTAAAAASILLASCAGAPRNDGAPLASIDADGMQQCVPYARLHSGIDIHGDAYTWWEQAAKHFKRSPSPSEGAVIVLANSAHLRGGHVAVVRGVVSAREILVDHANWFNDGAIYVGNPVIDASAAHDWSAVRVWNMRTGSWGIRTYPVRGFIQPAHRSKAMAVAQLVP